uniref:Cyclin-dependent kinase inhibitor domain-containing protein n=1 Tax=Vitis vinifera TaxID=29760 RepID=A5BIR8_VITVI|nr:hypothetical protein VITISV_012042 [Vitis vinifera]
MGKYMRKAKARCEVAVMEVSQPCLGVRTRAKTLALERLQKSRPRPSPPQSPPQQQASSSSYLQLRSRRLLKPPILVSNSKKHKQNLKEGQSEFEVESRFRFRCGSVGSVSLGCLSGEDGVQSPAVDLLKLGKEEQILEDNANDLGIEASFGENVLDFEARDRSTRETTPCSLIRDPETIRTPGSTTKPASSSGINRRMDNSRQGHVPTTQEMDQFFQSAEEEQQRVFTDKYNFDPVNDKPLSGRFEWVKLNR